MKKYAVPILLVALLFPALSHAISVVQTASSTVSNTKINKAFPGVVTAGNAILVVLGWGSGAGAVSSIVDNRSDGFILATTTNETIGTFGRMAIYYTTSSVGGATNVTTTFTGTTDDLHIRLYEVSGLATTTPLDAVKHTSTGTGTSWSITSPTTTVADEFVLAGFYDNTGINTWTAGAGYSNPLASNGAGLDSLFTESKVVAATSSILANATSTTSRASHLNIITTFEAPAASPPPDTTAPPMTFTSISDD